MNNKSVRWPGEAPAPYGAEGKRAFENHQRKVDGFLEELEQRKEQAKQKNKIK